MYDVQELFHLMRSTSKMVSKLSDEIYQRNPKIKDKLLLSTGNVFFEYMKHKLYFYEGIYYPIYYVMIRLDNGDLFIGTRFGKTRIESTEYDKFYEMPEKMKVKK